VAFALDQFGACKVGDVFEIVLTLLFLYLSFLKNGLFYCHEIMNAPSRTVDVPQLLFYRLFSFNCYFDCQSLP